MEAEKEVSRYLRSITPWQSMEIEVFKCFPYNQHFPIKNCPGCVWSNENSSRWPTSPTVSVGAVETATEVKDDLLWSEVSHVM